MKKIVTLFILTLMVLISACGVDEADEEACDLYSATVESADNGTISDEEMLEQLEEAYFLAESEPLINHLDDLLLYFEEGQGDLQDSINGIKVSCGLD